MGGDRDDREEREKAETRLDWMIREFQDARRRRLVKTSERTAESPPETETTGLIVPAPTR
jgi:hypothetical protein